VVGNASKGDDLYVGAIRSGDQDIVAAGLHIGATAPPPLEVVMKADGAHSASTVVDEGQGPVSEAHVVLLPDSPRTAQPALRAEWSGICILLGVAPGDCHAFAFAKVDSVDLRDPDTMANLDTSGKAVSVKEGDPESLPLGIFRLNDHEN
jgi:hypothetical protein